MLESGVLPGSAVESEKSLDQSRSWSSNDLMDRWSTSDSEAGGLISSGVNVSNIPWLSS